MVWRALQLLGGRSIGLLRYLVLARLLAPEHFGLFAIAVIPGQVALSATDMGVVPALIHRDHPERRHYDTAWTLGLLRGTVVALLLFLTAPLVAAFFSEPRATVFIRVLAMAPLITAFGSIRVAELERTLRFRALTLIDLPATAVAAIVAVALAAPLGAWALVAGTLAGGIAGTILSYVAAPYRPRLQVDAAAAATLLRFGRWIFAGAVLAVLGDALLRNAVARQLGTEALGLYFLAAGVALLPNQAVSGIVGAVAFPLHARVRTDPDRAAAVLRSSAVALMVALFPVYAVLLAVAPALVRDVLGPGWAGAEAVLQLLALAGLVGIAHDAAAPMLHGHGRPRDVAAMHGAVAFVAATLAWLLTPRFGVAGAAGGVVIAELAGAAVAIGFVRKLLPGRTPSVLRPLLVSSGAGAAGYGFALAITAAWPSLAGLLLATAVGGGVVTGIILLSDHTLQLGITADLRRAFPGLQRLLAPSPPG